MSVPILCGIYQIRNTANGRVYVGSAVNIAARWRGHRHALNKGKHRSRVLQRAWNKYGADAFSFTVIEPVERKEDLIAREQWWLDAAFATDWHYNCSPTAGSQLGLKRTEETIRKWRLLNVGRKQPPEAVEKTRLALIGRKYTAEHCAAISRAMKGKTRSAEHCASLSRVRKGQQTRPHSEETKMKISLALTGIKHSAERCKNNSLGHKGLPCKPLSTESRAKISLALRGIKHSPERCKNISLGHKRRAAAELLGYALNPSPSAA